MGMILQRRNLMLVPRDDFNPLLRDHLNEIWINGRLIASVRQCNYHLMLYCLHGEFYEVVYDKSCGRIAWIGDAKTADLEKYVSDIKVPAP